jgi:two-component system, LytTR family, sensor histidine kinase AlgZ
MHPILADREALVLYLFVFLLIGLALAAIIAVTGNVTWGASLVFCIPMTLLCGLMSLSSWYVCRSLPLKSTSILRIFGVLFVSAIVSAGLWVLIGEAFSSLLSSLPFFAPMAASYQSQLILFSSVGLGLYLLSVAVHYLMITFEQTQDAERRTLELKILAQTAELRALQSQVNPHFLFNSLNSISALVTKDPAAARSMTQLLADFLRQSLKFGTVDSIPLLEEIALCKRFLDIEQVRYGARLRFEQHIADESRTLAVPPLLLQPLIENAIVHGISHLVEGGTIVVNAETHGEKLFVSVQNPCDPDRPKTKGNRMGLENVRKRLLTLSSTDARLDVNERNGIFMANLVLPAVRA